MLQNAEIKAVADFSSSSGLRHLTALIILYPEFLALLATYISEVEIGL
jgi:hypothetical protein